MSDLGRVVFAVRHSQPLDAKRAKGRVSYSIGGFLITKYRA